MQQNIYRISNIKLSRNQAIALFLFITVMIFAVSALHTNLSKNNPILTWESAEIVVTKSLI